jgi:hypothetical protein
LTVTKMAKRLTAWISLFPNQKNDASPLLAGIAPPRKTP